MTEQNTNTHSEDKEDFSLTELEYQTCIGYLKDLIAENKINTLGFFKKDLTFDDFYHLNKNGLIETVPEIQYENSVVLFRAGKGILLILYSDNVEFFENLPHTDSKSKMFAIRAYISIDGSFSIDHDAIYLFDEKNSLTLLTSQDLPAEAMDYASKDASLIHQTQFLKLEKVFQG